MEVMSRYAVGRRSVECSDSEKNMSAYADQNHASGLMCVHEQVAKADCECPLYMKESNEQERG